MATFATSKVRGVAQPGSVSVWGAGGRKFKSCHPDLISKELRKYIVALFLFPVLN